MIDSNPRHGGDFHSVKAILAGAWFKDYLFRFLEFWHGLPEPRE
jgi:hypothetical protein